MRYICLRFSGDSEKIRIKLCTRKLFMEIPPDATIFEYYIKFLSGLEF